MECCEGASILIIEAIVEALLAIATQPQVYMCIALGRHLLIIPLGSRRGRLCRLLEDRLSKGRGNNNDVRLGRCRPHRNAINV